MIIILPILNRLDADRVNDPLLERAWLMVEAGGDVKEYHSIILQLEQRYPVAGAAPCRA